MKPQKWYILLGFTLILSSAALYLLHFSIFRDSHHIFIYLLGDMAFLPIEVLLVSLIMHKILSEREKRLMLNKLNIVIGAFFSEVGYKLMKVLSDFGSTHESRGRKRIILHEEFPLKPETFNIPAGLDSRAGDLGALRDHLVSKRDFLLRMLENPNLLEHESFTEMLRAVFHLAEELEYRPDVKRLTEPDLNHITVDMVRAYTSLVVQWLKYMRYLKSNYPYLYSLAVRINPLDPRAAIEITESERTAPDDDI